MGKMRNGQAEDLTLAKAKSAAGKWREFNPPQNETIVVTVHFASEFMDQSKYIYSTNVDRDIIFKSQFLVFYELCAFSK